MTVSLRKQTEFAQHSSRVESRWGVHATDSLILFSFQSNIEFANLIDQKKIGERKVLIGPARPRRPYSALVDMEVGGLLAIRSR